MPRARKAKSPSPRAASPVRSASPKAASPKPVKVAKAAKPVDKKELSALKSAMKTLGASPKAASLAKLLADGDKVGALGKSLVSGVTAVHGMMVKGKDSSAKLAKVADTLSKKVVKLEAKLAKAAEKAKVKAEKAKAAAAAKAAKAKAAKKSPAAKSPKARKPRAKKSVGGESLLDRLIFGGYADRVHQEQDAWEMNGGESQSVKDLVL